MVVLVNFANDLFKEKQQKQNKSAQEIGGIDKTYSFSPEDIDKHFFEDNHEILSNPKGNGYWLWKPYFILKVLQTLDEEDYLFYCDSGAYFINSLENLLKLQQKNKQDIIPFHNPHIEKYYTKRDAFILMECDCSEYTDTVQYLGGIHLWKKSPLTIRFLEEWISFAKDPRILTDIPNSMDKENYPEFVAHRHDQSIFSLLCKKYNISSYPDPTQFGNELRAKLNNPELIQLLHHTKGDKIKRNIGQKILREMSRLFKVKKSF